MKFYQPIVLAAFFGHASTSAATAAAANPNPNEEPQVQVFSPAASIVESELVNIAQTQSQLGSGTPTSDVQADEHEHGLLRKLSKGSSSRPGRGMIHSGKGQRRLRPNLSVNMSLGAGSKSGTGNGGSSKSGKVGSKSGKAAAVEAFPSFPANGEALKAAVRDYVTQECVASNGTCFVAQQWGFPMSKWNVSQVSDMSGLFYDPQGLFEDFNEDVTTWDTRSVLDMSFMFFEASKFNQPLSNWTVSKVQDVSLMFKGAQSFDQDISNWKFDDIEHMTSMLDGAMSFQQNLCAWGKQPAVQLALSSGNAKDMFRDSGCKLQVTPQNDDGPFCASCSDNGNGTDTSSQISLCRQVPGRPGFGLEEFDSSYSPVADPIFSELTLDVAQNEAKEITAQIASVSGSLSTAIGPWYPQASAGLAAISGVMQVVSIFLSKAEPDPTQELLKQGFTQVYGAIKELSDQINDGFGRIRLDLADNELDDLMGSLQAMQFAYQEMQEALNSADLSPQNKKTYTDKYRAACNRPHYSPEDIFRQFYGFACGDNEDRFCNVGQGQATGKCKFGIKKRQYILDIFYEEGKNDPTNINVFGEWLLKAMLLAQFHYATCLPADAASCNDPYVDPIRNKIADDMKQAFAETAHNVQKKNECVQANWRDYLSSDKSDDLIYKTEYAKKCFVDDRVNRSRIFTDENINDCLARETKRNLQNAFPDKRWAVVVFSAHSHGGTNLGFPNVVKRCDEEGGDNFGCISRDGVNFDDPAFTIDRYYFLMFRNRALDINGEPSQKDLSLENSISVLGNSTVNDVETLMRIGFKFELSADGNGGYCWGNPLDPLFELRGDDGGVNENTPGKEVIRKLSSEDGYIAIKFGSPIYYSFSPQTPKLDRIFSVGHGINVDWNLETIPGVSDCEDYLRVGTNPGLTGISLLVF